MVDEFKRFLEKNGLKYEEHLAENYLNFNTNNLNYVFQWQTDDPSYYRLALPRIDVAEADEISRKIAIELSSGFKVAKVIEMDDHYLWIVAEGFLYSFEKCDMVFGRLIFLLGNVIDEFRSKKGGAA